jgi:hypothetical protein
MSSATSTDAVPLKPESGARSDGLQPWQFFVLAALACATAVTFLVRGQGAIPVVLLTLLMGATALAGMAALRMLRPLVTTEYDRTRVIGHRTRAALEREKLLALRALKELEFDRAMGKVSEDDFHEVSSRLRARAGRLIKQLDAAEGYRDRIERDLAKRLAESGAAGDRSADAAPRAGRAERDPAEEGLKASGERAADAVRSCPSCATANDSDARFCKECGSKL